MQDKFSTLIGQQLLKETIDKRNSFPTAPWERRQWAARKKTWSVTNNSVCDQQQLLLFSVSNIHLKWIWLNCWLIGFRKLLSSSLGSLKIRFASLILELNCFCFKPFSIGCQQLYVQPNWNAYKLNLVQRSSRLRQKQSITGTVVLYAPLKVA